MIINLSPGVRTISRRHVLHQLPNLLILIDAISRDIQRRTAPKLTMESSFAWGTTCCPGSTSRIQSDRFCEFLSVGDTLMLLIHRPPNAPKKMLSNQCTRATSLFLQFILYHARITTRVFYRLAQFSDVNQNDSLKLVPQGAMTLGEKAINMIQGSEAPRQYEKYPSRREDTGGNNHGGLRPSFTPLGAEAIDIAEFSSIMLHAAKAIAM